MILEGTNKGENDRETNWQQCDRFLSISSLFQLQGSAQSGCQYLSGADSDRENEWASSCRLDHLRALERQLEEMLAVSEMEYKLMACCILRSTQ